MRKHVTVAHLGAPELDALLAQCHLEAEVAHDRPDHRARSVPARLRARGDDVDELVAVDDAAEPIDHHQPIAVAIERDAAAARTPGTVSCSSPGAVEPQPSLMLRPFGEQPIGMISAPRSASVRGTTL